MLKHRQDGLIFLHGLCLDTMIVGLFVALAELLRHTGWIQFGAGISWSSYLVAVAAAMLWSHRALAGLGARLGALSASAAGRLTRQQLSRLMVVLFAVAFATQDIAISRAFIALFLGLAGGLLFLANWLLPGRLAAFLFRAVKFRTLVLASTTDARRLQAWMAERRYLGQHVVGWVVPPSHADPAPAAGMAPLGSIAALRRLLAEHRVNQVLIDRRQFTAEETRIVLEEAEHAGCRVRYFLDLQSAMGEELAAVECDEGYAFAAGAAEPLDNPINQLVKRTLDLVVAIPAVCLVLPPLTAAVWWAQRRQSPGPLFLRQERSGLNRERFHIYKFRTMHTGCEHRIAQQATRNDDRVYAFGRFLRKTSLDEFPQFLNVLLGEMSVSGPRPHLLEHDRAFAAVMSSYYQRHFVKPGITGLAQSEGFRGEVSGPDVLRQRVERDLRYVRMWTLQLDLRILAATAFQVVRPPRAAY